MSHVQRAKPIALLLDEFENEHGPITNYADDDPMLLTFRKQCNLEPENYYFSYAVSWDYQRPARASFSPKCQAIATALATGKKPDVIAKELGTNVGAVRSLIYKVKMRRQTLSCVDVNDNPICEAEDIKGVYEALVYQGRYRGELAKFAHDLSQNEWEVHYKGHVIAFVSRHVYIQRFI